MFKYKLFAAVAVGLVGVGVLSATPARAAIPATVSPPVITTHCGISAAWGGAAVYRPASGHSVTVWRRTVDANTNGYCLLAKRTTVPKDTYMSILVGGRGKYTSGKSVSYATTVTRGNVLCSDLVIWKRVGDTGVKRLKTYYIDCHR